MPSLADLSRPSNGLLGDFTAGIDQRKQQIAKIFMGLLSNPEDTIAMLRAGDAEAHQRNLRTPAMDGSSRSVMPEIAQQGRDATMDVAMNVGGLLGMVSKVKPPAYAIEHRPMAEEGGAARLHDLTKSFGDDIYGPNALQFFGSGDRREKAVVNLLNKVRNNPDAEVTIYRGVPADVPGVINHGDWVTLSPEVAKDYGPNVVKMKVKASDVTSWADSLLEFGYYPKK